jgi:hypothetical protein
MDLGTILFERYKSIITEQTHKIILLEAGCELKDKEIGEYMDKVKDLEKKLEDLPKKKNK